MLKGALIIESLSTGVGFDDSQLMLRRLARFETTDTTPTQPAIWTILEFSSQMNPDALAELLSGALTSPSWYANFDTEEQAFVVFPGKVFQYPHGDQRRRDEVAAYARSVGVPDSQLDW